MRYQKVLLVGLLILGLTVNFCQSARAADDFEFQERLNEGASMFFIISLEKGDNLQVTLDPYQEGRFYLFLFDEQPEETNVDVDKNLKDEIYDNAVNYSLDKDEPKIDYNATSERIYYLQVILIKNGPDFFKLYSNRELTRFYLPQVPGYPFEILLLAVLGIVSVITFKLRKSFLNAEENH